MTYIPTYRHPGKHFTMNIINILKHNPSHDTQVHLGQLRNSGWMMDCTAEYAERMKGWHEVMDVGTL